MLRQNCVIISGEVKQPTVAIDVVNKNLEPAETLRNIKDEKVRCTLDRKAMKIQRVWVRCARGREKIHNATLGSQP